MGNREQKASSSINGHTMNAAQQADEKELRDNVIKIRQLITELDSFNYRVQTGSPDLGEEVRQGSFVAANKASELSDMLFRILNIIERNHDY